LRKSGFEIFVIVNDVNFFDSSRSELASMDINPIILPVHRSRFNPFQEMIFFIKLMRTLRRLAPAIVLLFTIKPNIYGSIACRFLKIPCINTISGLGSGMIHENLKTKLIRRFYSISLKASCKVLFQNDSDIEYFIGRKIIKRNLASYVPGSGIDTEKFKLHQGSLNRPRKYLFAGRILKDKGVYEFIEAIRDLKNNDSVNAVFLLGGIVDEHNISGISLKEIRIWEDLGLISYLGKTDNITRFFEKADVIVLPSYREGLSRVLLEAASCGKALITTDVPGCNDLVTEGINGFLCQPENAESLKCAIIRSLNTSDSELLQLGQNGRQIVIEKFSSDIVNRIYLDQISFCLRKPLPEKN
jgi:glycosyltransferase involved in cell wall biosynthesis